MSIKKKVPILVTSELLLKLYRNCLLRILLNQRIISAYSIAHSDLLRSHALLKLKCSDVVLTVYTCMSLFIILSSKTDNYKDGTWILIARNSTIIFCF